MPLECLIRIPTNLIPTHDDHGIQDNLKNAHQNDPNDRILCDAKKKVILREDVDLSAKMGSEHWFIMSVS